MSLAYFPLYPDRYEADTAHLSMLEDGAYNRLLRLCWRTPGCKLPDDLPWIMRQMRAASDADQAATLAVLSEFFVKARGKIWNKKLLQIYGQVSVAHGRKVEAGIKGAAAKALKSKQSDASTASSTAKANLKQPEPEPEPKEIKGVPPSISNKEEEGAQARASLSVFEEVMLAVGVDPAKPPKFWRGSAATTHILGWQLAYKLTDDEMVEVARLSRQDNPEPPDGPKALDRHMAAFAKAKASAGSIKPASVARSAPVHKPADRFANMKMWAASANGFGVMMGAIPSIDNSQTQQNGAFSVQADASAGMGAIPEVRSKVASMQNMVAPPDRGATGSWGGLTVDDLNPNRDHVYGDSVVNDIGETAKRGLAGFGAIVGNAAESARPVAEALETGVRYVTGTNSIKDRARDNADITNSIYIDPIKRADAVEFMKARQRGEMPGSIVPGFAVDKSPRPIPSPAGASPKSGSFGPRIGNAAATPPVVYRP